MCSSGATQTLCATPGKSWRNYPAREWGLEQILCSGEPRAVLGAGGTPGTLVLCRLPVLQQVINREHKHHPSTAVGLRDLCSLSSGSPQCSLGLYKLEEVILLYIILIACSTIGCLGRACQIYAPWRGMTCLLNCNRDKKNTAESKREKSNYELEWRSQSLLPSAAWCVRTSTNRSIKPAAFLVLPLAVVRSLCSVCGRALVPPLRCCPQPGGFTTPFICKIQGWDPKLLTWPEGSSERVKRNYLGCSFNTSLVWRARN